MGRAAVRKTKSESRRGNTDLVERWPTLEAAQRARRETLVAFIHEHNVRSKATIERRLEALRNEQPLTTDPAVTKPMRLLVEALLLQRCSCGLLAKQWVALTLR